MSFVRATLRVSRSSHSGNVAFASCVPHTCPVSYVAGSELAPGTTVAGYQIERLSGREERASKVVFSHAGDDGMLWTSEHWWLER